MAKFCITNIKSCFSKIKYLNENSKFEISFVDEQEDCMAVAIKKKVQCKVDNFVKKTDGFLIATGSLIYDGSLDYRKLLGANLDIQQARDLSIGHYAISIKKGDIITIWGDAVAAYDIFYYHNKEEFMVSNSLYDMAKVLGNKVSVNEMNVLEETIQCSILGGGTFYNEITRLHGDEFLSISLSNKTFKVCPVSVNYPYDNRNYREQVEEFAEILQEKANVIYKLFGNPTISMTGGLDARISLASYLSCGSSPCMAYGVGDTCFTNTQMNDLYIDRVFRDRFGLQLLESDWSSPSPIDAYWKLYYEEYGFLSRAYMASDKVVDYLENSPGNIVTFGYGGELYRNLPWIENKKTNYFTVDEYLDEHYFRVPLTKIILSSVSGYREHIRNKILTLCEKYHLDPEHIDNRDNVLLQLEYRKFADTIMLNYVNQMKYSFLLLFEYDSLKYSRIGVDSMKKSKFMLDVIMKLYPEVLEIPIFSHCQKRVFDKGKMELTFTKTDAAKMKIKSILSHIKNYSPDIVKSTYQLFKAQGTANKDLKREDEIWEFVNSHKQELPCLITPDAINRSSLSDMVKLIFTERILLSTKILLNE